MLRRTHFLFSVLCLCTAFSLSADDALTFVVTATRESEDIMDAPAQMTVITSEEIQSSGKTSLIQILEDVAGVSFRSYSGESQSQVSMRGFGENSFGRVVVLVDGKKLNNPDMNGLNWQSIPLSSIERIEVLDGPSAVLYGSGAVGGVINIITKESAAGVTAGATLSYGSFDTRRVQINGGFGTDLAGFLVSADYYSTEGFRDRSASKNTNVTLNGFADLTDKLTLKPSFSFSDIYYQMPGSLTKAQFEANPTQATNQKDDGTERDFGAALLTQLAVSDNFSIELPLSYMNKDRKADMGSGAYPYFNDRIQYQFEVKPKSVFSLETLVGDMRFIAGFDYEGALLQATSYTDEKRTTESYNFTVSQFVYAPYATGMISLPGNFGINAGVRYNWASIQAEKEKASIDETDTYSGFVWDVSLLFKPLESLSVYAKYNTLFRYPFVDEKAELVGLGDKFNSDLIPETGYNIEAGAKYAFSSLLSARGTVYYMLMEDEIAYTIKNVNLDKTQRIGGNIDLSFTPIKLIELKGTASYVKATFVEGDNKDKPISFVPSVTGRAEALLHFPIGISIGSDISFTGESEYRYADAFGSVKEDVSYYYLLGFSAQCTPTVLNGKFSVTLRLDNILDTQYPSFLAYGSDPITWEYYGAYYPAAGRSLSISASYKY